MHRCLVSLGANKGDPRETLLAASARLRKKLQVNDSAFLMSGLYKTPPVGGPGGQPPFLNAVVGFETRASPWDVWAILRDAETYFGRQRNQRWEARSLDLDILLYDDLRLWTPQLKIPHPRMCMRRFMLVPSQEIVPAWRDPVTGRSIAELAKRMDGSAGSLTLFSDQEDAVVILEEAARLALANWESLDSDCSGLNASRSVHLRKFSRAEDPFENLDATPATKLLVVLARGGPMDVAWEDLHAKLAARMNLRDKLNIEPWKCDIPRYLLAGKDKTWVIHELVAALEAMDCPVERIPL